MEQARTQLVGAMQLDYPQIDKEAKAVGISWPLPKVFQLIEQHPIFPQHSNWSNPVMLIIRGDTFPISGTQSVSNIPNLRKLGGIGTESFTYVYNWGGQYR